MYFDVFNRPHWTVADTILSNIYYPKNKNEVNVALSINGKNYSGKSIAEVIDKFENDYSKTVKARIEAKAKIETKFTDINGNKFAIKNVKFSPPATIVFWSDNTKTVVKACAEEPFDKEKGMAMAIIKKICGNNREYFEMFKEYCNG